MRTSIIIGDLLLSNQDRIDWIKNVLISSHIISNNLNDKRDYHFPNDYNFVEFRNGTFKSPYIVTVINKRIVTYIISKDYINKRNQKLVIEISGNNAIIKKYTKKKIITDILKQDKNYNYLKENDFTVLYFPNNENEVISFIEFDNGNFLVNSLENNISSNNFQDNLRNVTRKQVVEMIIEETFE